MSKSSSARWLEWNARMSHKNVCQIGTVHLAPRLGFAHISPSIAEKRRSRHCFCTAAMLAMSGWNVCTSLCVFTRVWTAVCPFSGWLGVSDAKSGHLQHTSLCCAEVRLLHHCSGSTQTIHARLYIRNNNHARRPPSFQERSSCKVAAFPLSCTTSTISSWNSIY